MNNNINKKHFLLQKTINISNTKIKKRSLNFFNKM